MKLSTGRLATLRGWHLFILIFLALCLTLIMQIVGAPLTTTAAPAGIISFEFAGELGKVKQILASWDEQAQLHAALSLGLDYLYLVTYTLAIAATCLRVAASWQARRPRLARLGRSLGWSQGIAAMLDAIENLALLRLLFGSTATFWPPLAWVCAALKFTLVLSGLAYALATPLLHLLSPATTAPGERANS